MKKIHTPYRNYATKKMLKTVEGEMRKQNQFNRIVELENIAQEKYFKHNSITEFYDILLDEDELKEYKKLYKDYYGEKFNF